ncbi:unnamed protein product, partial [Owenia fusiformis]
TIASGRPPNGITKNGSVNHINEAGDKLDNETPCHRSKGVKVDPIIVETCLTDAVHVQRPDDGTTKIPRVHENQVRSGLQDRVLDDTVYRDRPDGGTNKIACSPKSEVEFGVEEKPLDEEGKVHLEVSKEAGLLNAKISITVDFCIETILCDMIESELENYSISKELHSIKNTEDETVQNVNNDCTGFKKHLPLRYKEPVMQCVVNESPASYVGQATHETMQHTPDVNEVLYFGSENPNKTENMAFPSLKTKIVNLESLVNHYDFVKPDIENSVLFDHPYSQKGCTEVDAERKRHVEEHRGFNIKDIISACVTNIQSAQNEQKDCTENYTVKRSTRSTNIRTLSTMATANIETNDHSLKKNFHKRGLLSTNEENTSIHKDQINDTETNKDARRLTHDQKINDHQEEKSSQTMKKICNMKDVEQSIGQVKQLEKSVHANGKRRAIFPIQIDEDDVFQCPHCDMSYSMKSKLKNHLRLHQDSEILTLQHCKIKRCPYSTYSLDLYNQHIKGHEGSHSCSCSICEYGSPTVKGLKQHMALHGVKQLKHNHFMRKRGLAPMHKSRKDSSHIYRCNQCDLKTNQFKKLQKHKQTCRLKSQTLSVDSIVTPQSNIQNRVEQEPDRPISSPTIRGTCTSYNCPICQYSSSKSGWLEKHTRFHSPQAGCFVCEHCNFSSFQSSRVRQHQTRDHKVTKTEVIDNNRDAHINGILHVENNAVQQNPRASQFDDSETYQSVCENNIKSENPLKRKLPNENCDEFTKEIVQQSQNNQIHLVNTKTCMVRLPRIDREIARMCKKRKVTDDERNANDSDQPEIVAEDFPMDYESTVDSECEGMNIFICTACPYFTRFTGYFRRHTLHHRVQRGLTCRHCSYSSDYQKSMHRHKKWHNKARKGM